jgi:TM2 domain-containing membrane protein YozV
MTTGFGRKGISSSAAMPSSSMPAGGLRARGMAAASPAARAEPARAGGEQVSPQMAAFLAEERARRQQEGGREDDVRDYAGDIDRLPVRRHQVTRDRNMMVAYLLWFFACALSAHRFYLGDYRNALLQVGGWIGGLVLAVIAPSAGVIVMGLAGLWMLADAFLIPGIYRRNCTSPDTSAIFA